MTALRIAGLCATAVGAVWGLGFACWYALRPQTRRTWYRSEYGRFMMATCVIVGLFLAVLGVATLWPASWLAWPFVVTYFGLCFLMVWPARLLWKANRDVKDSTMDDRDSFWWRLVNLNPAVLRGLVVGGVGLAGAVGIVVVPGLPDALLGVWVPATALVQALWTRAGVTPNARVVVRAPDPVGDPDTVAPGEAVSRAPLYELEAAARRAPARWPRA